MTARSDLLDYLDDLRARVQSGDVTNVMLVAWGLVYEVRVSGEPATSSALHGAALALLAATHQTIDEGDYIDTDEDAVEILPAKRKPTEPN